jgi:hypothetical protein
MLWLELNQDVHVAATREIAAEHRSKKRQPADVMFSTECG